MLRITHDLGIVARIAHRVSVMYAGEVAEGADRRRAVRQSRASLHAGPAALRPVPGKIKRDEPLGSILGTVPRIGPGFEGCGFRERRDFADDDLRLPTDPRAMPRSATADFLMQVAGMNAAIEVRPSRRTFRVKGRLLGADCHVRRGRRRILRRAAGRRP